MPEQPLVRTPMRMPAVGLRRLSISALICSTAAGVTDMTCGRGRRGLAPGWAVVGAAVDMNAYSLISSSTFFAALAR